eukprot:508025-Karenia_brevis.AAC.1
MHATSQPGITWYEMFLLAAAMMPNPLDFTSSSTAQVAKNITHVLREFAVEFNKFVKFAIDPQHHNIFLASSKQENRMRAYGFTNRPQH